MHATAWALDEFASFDMFASVPDVPALPAAAGDHASHDLSHQFHAEIARAETEAYSRGRADGEQAARETLDSMLASAMQALDDAAHSVRLHEARWTANAEENITAIAVLVARHIVQREIATDPSIVSALVRDAMAQYPIDQEITIRLHPDDLTACRGAIAQDEVASRTLRWMADPTLIRGGCLTEGRERIIDGRVDTALERAYRNIAGVQAS
jgi:flagellar assembly protein FliH